MKKPTFFLVGAPKSGTTSLATWLSGHPDIFMSPVKEPHHFCSDFGYKEYNNANKYLSLFKGAKSRHDAVGEASATYLYSKDAIKNINSEIPDAKFIVLLRNPVEMAPSLHGQFVFDRDEDIEDFEDAWRAQEDRQTGERVPSSCREPTFLLYKDACSIGAQLERIYDHVSGDRVLPILLEDIKNDPRGVWIDIIYFLGVSDDGRTNFPVVNSAKERRSKLLGHITEGYENIRRYLGIRPLLTGILGSIDNVNTRKSIRAPLSVRMRQELVDSFEEDILLLSRILGRDLRHWLRE